MIFFRFSNKCDFSQDFLFRQKWTTNKYFVVLKNAYCIKKNIVLHDIPSNRKDGNRKLCYFPLDGKSKKKTTQKSFLLGNFRFGFLSDGLPIRQNNGYLFQKLLNQKMSVGRTAGYMFRPHRGQEIRLIVRLIVRLQRSNRRRVTTNGYRQTLNTHKYMYVLKKQVKFLMVRFGTTLTPFFNLKTHILHSLTP